MTSQGDIQHQEPFLKINDKFEHKFTGPFQKHLHKIPLCTLSLLILTTYTDDHVGRRFDECAIMKEAQAGIKT